MTGAAIFAAAILAVLVCGRWLVRAAVLALQLGWVLLCAVLWCGWFLAHPRDALASLRAAIADAEAESAIRRLNQGLI
jgi:uncharacterized membrane protein